MIVNGRSGASSWPPQCRRSGAPRPSSPTSPRRRGPRRPSSGSPRSTSSSTTSASSRPRRSSTSPTTPGGRCLEVNVLSGVRLARHYLQEMLERGSGRIVFIASEAAIMPPPEMASYSGSKAMQLSLSRSLADLTRGTGVTVNTVMPGTTKTEGVVELVRASFRTCPGGGRAALRPRGARDIADPAPHRAGGDRQLRRLRREPARGGHQRRRPARRRRHRAPHALSALNRTSAAVSGAGESATQDA